MIIRLFPYKKRIFYDVKSSEKYYESLRVPNEIMMSDNWDACKFNSTNTHFLNRS